MREVVHLLRSKKTPPDWGFRLQELGLLAVLGIAAWVLVLHEPSLAGHNLTWMHALIKDYKETAVVWVALVVVLGILAETSYNDFAGSLLKLPGKLTFWLIHVVLIVLGLFLAGAATGFGMALGDG